MTDGSSARLSCPKCGSENPPGALFCANCGFALSAGAPPPPPPPPPSGPQAWAQQAFTGSAPQAQATLQMEAGGAHGLLLSAIGALDSKVLSDQPPGYIQFEIGKRNVLITGGLRLRYRCEATITPSGPAQSTIRVSSRLDWSSATAFIVLSLVMLLFIGVFIIPIVIVGWSFWHVAYNWPKEVSETVVRGLGAGGSQPLMAAAAAHAPPSQSAPQPMPSRPPSNPVTSEEETVHEQLRKLKELHDGGILTDEEFATKKAELLARL